jgi:hypothetical protein
MIGSDILSPTRFFRSLATCDDHILFDLSSIFSQPENINLAEKAHNPEHIYLDQISFASWGS